MHITTFEAGDFNLKSRNDGILVVITYRRILFCAKLVRLIGLTHNDRVLLHQDNLEPHVWYMSINDKGFRLKGKGKCESLSFSCVEFTTMVLNAFGLDKTGSMNFKVDEEPIVEDSVRYWKLRPEVEP